MFLKNSQYLYTCVGALQFYQKQISTWVFSCEYYHFFKNSFSIELLWWLLLDGGVSWEICCFLLGSVLLLSRSSEIGCNISWIFFFEMCYFYSTNVPFINVLSFIYERALFIDSLLLFTNVSLKCLNLTNHCTTKRDRVWKYNLSFFFCSFTKDFISFNKVVFERSRTRTSEEHLWTAVKITSFLYLPWFLGKIV